MKKLLLLICGTFLIAQVSFGNEANKNALVSNYAGINYELDPIIANDFNVLKSNPTGAGRVWLNLANAEGAFKQLLVGYVAGATNGWDNLYDAVSSNSNPYVDFYSIDGVKKLTIQGRAIPFLITDEVPLGYKTTIDGVFKISLGNIDGLFVDQDIFLVDKMTNVIYNLKNGSYSFTTSVGRFDDRFVLLYANNVPVDSILINEPIVSDGMDSVIEVPEVPTPIVTDPIVVIPDVPATIVTDSIVVIPDVPAPVVPNPPVTVPEVPTVIVTDPIVVISEVPAPVVPNPPVTVPEVLTPIVTDPIVVIPEVPAPVVPNPPVTVPEVSTPIVPESEFAISIATDEVSDLLASDIVTNVYGAKEKSVIVSVNNNQITINSVEAPINQVFIYNLGQMQLFERININSNEFVIQDIATSKQVLIIRIQLNNGKLETSKIIL